MGLSIVIFTGNKADRLDFVLSRVSIIADELVVVVDEQAATCNEPIAKKYTSNISITKHCPVEFQLAKMIALCHEDWILRLDDDETVSEKWFISEHVNKLLRDRYHTHYWIPRRWVIPPGEVYIANNHWYPDYQMRLFRNIPSILTLPKNIHEPLSVAGFPKFLSDMWLIHWDLIWKTRQEREDKVKNYQARSNYSGSEFYLYEDRIFETKKLDNVEYQQFFPTSDHSKDNYFEAKISVAGLPHFVKCGQKYAVTINIQNCSSRALQPTNDFSNSGTIFVSHHFFKLNNGKIENYEFDLPRSQFPSYLLPGQATEFIYSFQAPRLPGYYQIQFDLVEENIAWFSKHCSLTSYPIIAEPSYPIIPYEIDRTPRNCIILGSGRSGTSMMAGICYLSGYYMGDNLYDESFARDANPKGFYEDKRINKINEEILSIFDPPTWHLQENHRWLSSVHSPVPSIDIGYIEELITKYVNRQPFCYKDPRFSFTLPAWRRYLPKDCVIICMFRNPETTAKSIVKECQTESQYHYIKMTRERALAVYTAFYSSVLSWHSQIDLDCIFIHYDQLFFGLRCLELEKLLNVHLDKDFIEPSLRRTATISPANTTEANIYHELCRLAEYNEPERNNAKNN